MIKVSENFKNAVINGTTSNQLDICVFGYNTDGSNLHIYNSNIVSESMAIEQAISDDSDLKFGGCIASSFEIEVFGIPDLTGRYITVTIIQTAYAPTYPSYKTYPGANTYPGSTVCKQDFAVFSGEIFSCKMSKNHLTRKIVAYDRFYWRGSINCTQVYRGFHATIPSGYKVTSVANMRKNLCTNYGLVEEYTNTELPIDSMMIEQTESKVTVTEVLRALCEMGGVFCILNGKGNIEYHTLSDDSEIPDTICKPGTEEYGFQYADCEYEEFAKNFTGILHRKKDGGFSWFGFTEGNSFYVLDENLIADAYTGFSSWYDEMKKIEEESSEYDWHIFMKYLRFEPYTPMSLKAPCRLWVQVGDKIKFNVNMYEVAPDGTVISKTKVITSYVLSRRIKGIQALMDEFSANAEDVKYTENSVFDD